MGGQRVFGFRLILIDDGRSRLKDSKNAESHRPWFARGCTVDEIRNGKSVHDWTHWDTGNMLRQRRGAAK